MLTDVLSLFVVMYQSSYSLSALYFSSDHRHWTHLVTLQHCNHSGMLLPLNTLDDNLECGIDNSSDSLYIHFFLYSCTDLIVDLLVYNNFVLAEKLESL